MKVELIRAAAAVNLSPHRHPFLNPYNGCSMGCPFCYWLSQAGWENRIQVKTNIAVLLSEYLKTFNRSEYLYLGSVCDPFMELEKKYRLTRDCLAVIRAAKVPLVITTSAVSEVILEELPLLAPMKEKVIVVVELARIPQIEAMNRGGQHQGIVHARKLNEAGFTVWTTLAPVLPEITSLPAVLKALPEEIPVYVDQLDCGEADIQGRRVMEWIKKDYPHLEALYRRIIVNRDDSFYRQFFRTYEGNQRVRRFPFNLPPLSPLASGSG